MPVTRQKSLIKLAEIAPEDFLAQIKSFLEEHEIDIYRLHKKKVKKRIILDTDNGPIEMKAASLRYVCFLKSLKCVNCGLKGNIIFIEKFPKDSVPHANLYHLNKNGALMLFTKDHIKPKSLGGSDSISNLQTMCSACNEAKSDKYIVKTASP